MKGCTLSPNQPGAPILYIGHTVFLTCGQQPHNRFRDPEGS